MKHSRLCTKLVYSHVGILPYLCITRRIIDTFFYIGSDGVTGIRLFVLLFEWGQDEPGHAVADGVAEGNEYNTDEDQSNQHVHCGFLPTPLISRITDS